MGLFENLFKAQGCQTEVKPDLKAGKKEWFEEFACCLSQTAEEYFLMYFDV